jgi:hypothetical protein
VEYEIGLFIGQLNFYNHLVVRYRASAHPSTSTALRTIGA